MGYTPNLKFGAFSESRNHRFVNRGVTQVAAAHMTKRPMSLKRHHDSTTIQNQGVSPIWKTEA